MIVLVDVLARGHREDHVRHDLDQPDQSPSARAEPVRRYGTVTHDYAQDRLRKEIRKLAEDQGTESPGKAQRRVGIVLVGSVGRTVGSDIIGSRRSGPANRDDESRASAYNSGPARVPADMLAVTEE